MVPKSILVYNKNAVLVESLLRHGAQFEKSEREETTLEQNICFVICMKFFKIETCNATCHGKNELVISFFSIKKSKTKIMEIHVAV